MYYHFIMFAHLMFVTFKSLMYFMATRCCDTSIVWK